MLSRFVGYAFVALAVVWPGIASSQDAPPCTLTDEGAASGWSLSDVLALDGSVRLEAVAGGSRLHVYEWGDQHATVALYGSRTGAPVRELYRSRLHEDGAFDEQSPDGSREVFGGPGRQTVLFDLQTGVALASLPELTNRDFVQFTEDGRILVVRAANGRMERRDARSGALLTAAQGEAGDAGARMLPDGGRLVLSGRTQTELWDMIAGRRLAVSPLVGEVEISANGDRIAIGGDYQFALWDARTGRTLAQGPAGNETWYDLVRPPRPRRPFTADGAFLLISEPDGHGRVLDARSGRRRLDLGVLAEPPPGLVVHYQIAASPDGRTLVARGEDGQAVLWDLRRGRRLARLGAYDTGSAYPSYLQDDIYLPQSAVDFTYSPEGERLLAKDQHGVVTLWDARRGRLIARVTDLHGDDEFETSKSGGRAAVIRDDGRIEVWNARSGARIAELGPFKRNGLELTFSNDDKWLVTDADDAVRLWDLETGRAHANLGRPGGSTGEAKFFPDGTRLTVDQTTADGARHSILWDVQAGRRLADVGEAGEIEVVQVGEHTLAVETTKVWDASQGLQVAVCLKTQEGELLTDDSAGDALLLVHGDEGAAAFRLAPPAGL